MADLVEILNKKLNEFADDIILCFPEVSTDFDVFKTMLNVAVCVDKEAPLRMFEQCVVKPYEDYILNRNEDFFLTETYDPSYTDINIVNKIKKVWKTMDELNKSIVWKYLDVLLKLSKACVSQKTT